MRLINLFILCIITFALSAQDQPVLRMDQGMFATKYFSGSDYLTKQQFETIIHKDPLSSSLWSQSKSLGTTGIGLLVGSVGFLTIGILSDEPSSSLVWLSGAVVLDVAALVCVLKAQKKSRQAVDAYNGLDISLGITPHGGGLVLTF